MSPIFAPPPTRRRVAVLGATGAVGQTFVSLLANHPWFKLVEVAASDRSAGRSYADVTRWLEGSPLPAEIAALTVLPCDAGRISADVVFSALDSSIAGEVEAQCAAAGKIVLTNAKNHRMEPDVPLVIAEVNAGHLVALRAQRGRRGWTGGIVANGNCASIVAALALAPIHQAFGITRAIVVTMQAISGAGYPGVPSLDILGNVIPFIGDEEPKIETEVQKFLGTLEDGLIRSAQFPVSAHANRVPVEHGHTVCISVALDRKATPNLVEEAIETWRGADEVQGLPSAPERPVILSHAPDRPQPRRDVYAGRGMSVVVGRVRTDPVFDIKLVAMGHNVVRGAAGGSVLNAELMMSLGLLPTA